MVPFSFEELQDLGVYDGKAFNFLVKKSRSESIAYVVFHSEEKEFSSGLKKLELFIANQVSDFLNYRVIEYN